MKHRILLMKSIAMMFVALFVVTGCAKQVVERAERYFWPPSPNPPRIEWLKAYSSQLDIEQSAVQRFMSTLVGEDQAISLLKPVEIKSVPEFNRFYVSDLGRSAVIVFDLEKRELRQLKTPDGITPISHPLSIVVDNEKNLYVLDRRSSSIYIFDSSEKYQRSINLKSLSVTNPVAMAIDRRSERLYVSNAVSRSIVVLGLDGRYLNKIGSGGDGDGQFTLPISVAVNSRGQIIIADAFGVSVQIFDSEGKFLRRFGQRGDGAGDFQLIKSVAVDSEDNIYVVDGRMHNITVFNQQGELLLVLGGYYAVSLSGKLAPGGFSVPIGLDIDANDRIYVVDQLNARVQVFQYLSKKYQRSLRGE